MNTATLEQVLAATGYLPDGRPAPGLRLGAEAQSSRHGRVFVPDALWRSASSLTVYFKFEQSAPADDLVSQWRREVWNEGFAPLLWVISPQGQHLGTISLPDLPANFAWGDDDGRTLYCLTAPSSHAWHASQAPLGAIHAVHVDTPHAGLP